MNQLQSCNCANQIIEFTTERNSFDLPIHMNITYSAKKKVSMSEATAKISFQYTFIELSISYGLSGYRTT